jgi:hemerythrin-like domain-containing protein
MMKATEELRSEHSGILRMLQILETICNTRITAEGFPADHLREIMEFLKVFVDQCHHGKEEDFLFPELERAGVQREGGPIGVLLDEHEQGRRLVQEMSTALQSIRESRQHDPSSLLQPARGYIDLLRQHIDKENNQLFITAEQRLSSKTQDDMAESFQNLERERIGEGRHEAFHNLMDRLSALYLQQQG